MMETSTGLKRFEKNSTTIPEATDSGHRIDALVHPYRDWSRQDQGRRLRSHVGASARKPGESRQNSLQVVWELHTNSVFIVTHLAIWAEQERQCETSKGTPIILII